MKGCDIMKKMFSLCLMLIILNISTVSNAERNLVNIDGDFYWNGDKNFILCPRSSGSSGWYSILDLSSIYIKENNSKTVTISMISYSVSPDGNIENKHLFTLKKEKVFNGYFEIDGFMSRSTPLMINSYYQLVNQIEKHTNDKIKALDFWGGYVCKRDKYIWIIPKIPDKDDNLAIFEHIIPKYMQNELNTEIVLSPMFLYYIFGPYHADEFESHLNTQYARTSNGNWVQVTNTNIANFIKTRGLSNRSNWKNIPYGILGDIAKDVCSFSANYAKTGKYK